MLDGGPRDAQLESDMKDIAIFAAMLRARSAVASAAPDQAALTAATAIIDEVEEAFGPGPVLDYERRRYRLAMGLDGGPAQDPPAFGLGAWEHRALGRSLLEAGDLTGAAEQLAAARAIEPGGPWENFYYGLCAYRLGAFQEAVAAFSVCIGSRPALSDGFYNRGLAYAAQNMHQQALEDYRRALSLDPNHPAKAAITRLLADPALK
jgi:tetratricopeptide (TPR) repeat protein